MTFRKAFGPYTVEQHSNACRTGLLSHGDRGRSTEGWTPGCGQLQLPVGDCPGARDGVVGEGRRPTQSLPQTGDHMAPLGAVSSQRAQRVPRWTETRTDRDLKHCQHVLAVFSRGPYPHTLVWPLSQQRVCHCVKSVREISLNYGRGSKCGSGVANGVAHTAVLPGS